MLDQQTLMALQAMIQSGDFDDQLAQSDMAMQRADLLGQPSGRRFETGVGAGLNAIGDMFRAGASLKQHNAAVDARASTQGELSKHRSKLLQALLGQQPGMQNPAQVSPLLLSSMPPLTDY